MFHVSDILHQFSHIVSDKSSEVNVATFDVSDA